MFRQKGSHVQRTPPNPLRIIIVEDSADDAELMLDELRRANYEPEWIRVETAEAFVACLDSPVDLILADFALPLFDGLTALAIIQKRDLDIPFILVSGTVGEEIAVEAMRAGAADYFLKDRLVRLGPAVERAQAERALRTNQLRATAELRYEHDLLDRLMNNLPDLIFFKDVDSRFVRINQTAAASFGLSHPDDAIGKSDLDIQPPEIAQAFIADDCKVMAMRVPIRDNLKPIMSATGETRWLSTTKAPTYNPDGSISGIVGIGRDVTDRKAADEARNESEARYRSLFEEAPVMYILAENRDGIPYVSDCNQLFLRTLGYTREEAIGRHLQDFIFVNSWSDLKSNFSRTLKGETFEFERQLVSRDGRIVESLVQTRPVRDASGKVIATRSTLIDITERKFLERKLVHQATHDGLTGLPNREHFTTSLETELKTINPGTPPPAVIFIDLDNFKAVNDSLGHVVGDQLLISVSQRLEGCLGPGTLLARFGGDEFTVLLPGRTEQNCATDTAASILNALRAPHFIGEREFRIGASIGIVEASADVLTAEDLLQAADIALYRAKAAGRSQFRLYEPEMAKEVRARVDLESELERAVELGQLCLYYQPEIDLDTGRIVGAEALIRWNHPTRGVLAPGAFIDIAEESGLILEIGTWVLEAACNQLDEWRTKYPFTKHMELGVNVSARQLRESNFVDLVAGSQRRAGLPPGQLKLEITERVVVEDAISEHAVLQELRRARVKLAIDDFGTGYSSLGYLHRWPVDTIKIDRSFVAGIHKDEGSEKLVQAIIGLANLFEIGVTAEGIETPEQLSWLTSAGVRRGQGYYFSRPVPAAEFGHLIAENDTQINEQRQRNPKKASEHSAYLVGSAPI